MSTNKEQLTFTELDPQLASAILFHFVEVIMDKQQIWVKPPDNPTFYIAVSDPTEQKYLGIADVIIKHDGIAYFDFLVDPDYQNQGIGKELLKNVLRLCAEKGVKKLRAAVSYGSVSSWLLTSSGFTVMQEPSLFEQSLQPRLMFLEYTF